jgi:hypothetical protein
LGLICVYKADVRVGPNVWGEVYSFRPIPDCVYPATDRGIDGHGVEFSWCTRFVIQAPEGASFITRPESGMESVTDPQRPDGFVVLGPKVILDRARHDRGGFGLLRIYWRYWENRAVADRDEENRRRSAEEGDAGTDDRWLTRTIGHGRMP